MSGTNIKVVCRFRPMNRMEIESHSDECIDIDGETTVRIRNSTTVSGPEKDGFTFDRVFRSSSQQPEIFDFGVKGIVEDVMGGFNGTLFCYGQTGSGKTFTMMGTDIENPTLKGLIPRITEQIFASIISADSAIEYTVKVSYMEIYMERIKDLLNPIEDNLSIHEDKARGVYVKGLTEVYVGSEAEVYNVMKLGGSARAVSATNMNAESSRSHSIFVLGIHQRNVETGTQKSGNLYLVDLAGSEKVGKTGATGQVLEEAKKINQSLSSLGNVINSLTDGKSTHIPYRNSKLTRILQESLGGNSRTTLIINCSPASFNEAETVSTLRFGMRAKSIKNKARVNTELSSAELKKQLAVTKGEARLFKFFSNALEGEVTIWRGGQPVAEPDWATLDKARAAIRSGEDEGAATSGASAVSKRALGMTALPASPMPSSLSGLSTRSSTPAGMLLDATGRETPLRGLDADERDDFLRRENELNDQLTEKDRNLAESELAMVAMQKELAYHKDLAETMAKDNSAINLEVTELRMSQTRFETDAREMASMLDSEKDRVAELEKAFETQRLQFEELTHAQAAAVADERGRKKADMLADMMAKIDTGGAFTDASAEKLHLILSKLDNLASDAGPLGSGLVIETRETIRRHLADNQTIQRDLQDRLRRTLEDAELQAQRSDDLQELLLQREIAYEELLRQQGDGLGLDDLKAQYEAQFQAKQSVFELESSTFQRQLEAKNDELAKAQDELDEKVNEVEDLTRYIRDSAPGAGGSASTAHLAQELERVRKIAEVQHAEFEIMKRNLMRDVTDRCEKVVELQIQLDEVREKYKAIARSTNAKAHNKKMQTLEYNLGQLNEVVRSLVFQNASLKKDQNTTNRKLDERKERIINLERLVAQGENQLRAKELEYQRVTRDLRDQLSNAQTRDQGIRGGGLGFGRIAVPLRGGGGGNVPQPAGMSSGYAGMPAGAGSSNIAGEEVSSKRPSWFFGQKS